MKSLLKRSALIVLLFSNLVTYAHNNMEINADSLNAKEQSIVTISAFTAIGNMVSLNKALHEGLDAGLTISEIKEVIVQMYAYAGFPRSLNALNTYMTVLSDRKSKGINDMVGKEASPYPVNKSKLEFGTENQMRLIGSPVKGKVYDFAPAIDVFLKEHLFGDIFGRDILDYKTREIATIAALASLGGTENQLRSHLNVGMYNGLTKAQVTHIVSLIKTKVGDMEGSRANTVLQAVLNPNSPPSAGNPNFVGNVFVTSMVSPDSLFNTQMGSVTFEAGARSNWHYHPSGQILVITDGTAYYQEEGKPKQILIKGQTVKCPPNVKHWHGASPHGPMTHLGLTPNVEKGGVVWLQKVTEEEYKGN
jgi:4-carboxymuconolactone decarboxylase